MLFQQAHPRNCDILCAAVLFITLFLAALVHWEFVLLVTVLFIASWRIFRIAHRVARDFRLSLAASAGARGARTRDGDAAASAATTRI